MVISKTTKWPLKTCTSAMRPNTDYFITNLESGERGGGVLCGIYSSETHMHTWFPQYCTSKGPIYMEGWRCTDIGIFVSLAQKLQGLL